eukprot:TRINITY_DN10134_c0_g1_i1.p1 TRINITY_DN10134_c0_g1~~TRINITY_DN10134_c0_g1_i1.p1  ORF type:complete len:349 (+),score=103.23 TRINITY_DN10134_c0_g1_i1:50-1096(+)
MSDDENIPDGETANKLVKEFEGVTDTNSALAQQYLQENGWSLEKSLDVFFADKIKDQDAAMARRLQQETEDNQPSEKSIEDGLNDGTLTTMAPTELTMISWNIDGLDLKNIRKRTKGVCKIIEDEKADIVFLQEVIPETLDYIQSKLSGYECTRGVDGDYFVATLLRWGRVYKDSSKIVSFPGTMMGRHILHVKAHCGQVKFDLLNTHLESTAEHAEQRILQLKQSFKIMAESSAAGSNVIFGGDLNLRDKELAACGGLPAGTTDCWEDCGARQLVKYTWDMTRNTNLEWQGKFKPRCRFDRLYLRPSRQFAVSAMHFGLVGLQKIQGTQSFPSDHWGLMVKLKLNQG